MLCFLTYAPYPIIHMHSYVDVPDELLEDPAAAFRHIAADAERQVDM